MKKFLASLMVAFLLVIAAILVRCFVHRNIGISSAITMAVLTWAAGCCWASLHFYERHRDVVLKCWLLFFSVGVTYAVTDLGLGYFLLRPLSPPTIPDRYVHHKLEPNSRSRIVTRDFDYIQRVNNLGMRGPDVTVAKAPNTFRVLMLGDSFTMGKGVQDNETFSAVVEQALNARKAGLRGKSHVEVLNGGVDSYAPILELFQLTKQLPPLDADLVVLNFDMSDLIQESAYRKGAARGSHGELLGVSGIGDAQPGGAPQGMDRLAETVRTWADRHLYFTSLLLFNLERRLQKPTGDLTLNEAVNMKNPEILRHTLADDPEDRTQQWRNVFDSLTAIQEYCQSHSMDFIITVYPWGHQVNAREWGPGRTAFLPDTVVVGDQSIRAIEDFGRRVQIEVLNVFPAFRAYPGPAPLYFQYDPHWTPEGHKVMAKALEQYLIQRYSTGS